MERVERIKELLSKKAEIDKELDVIRQQMREEKVAFTATRKPRAKKQGDLQLTKLELAKK